VSGEYEGPALDNGRIKTKLLCQKGSTILVDAIKLRRIRKPVNRYFPKL
jgi:hypothetical protein